MFSRKKNSKGIVFVGLSGGVDSAVSAALLQQEGYAVTGVFIRIALPGYPCSAGADKVEAMRVAAHLRIPFLELDLSEAYEKTVFASSIGAFSKGRTPNPDALCNREIKFGAFYAFARARGADFVATGHYARTCTSGGRTQLLAGADPDKDQSYFLWMVPEEVLRRTLFPVGGMHKSRVRALAQTLGLPNAARKDSQGLCFLGDLTIEDLLERELTLTPGDVLAESGAVIGAHSGAARFTLGQRHGFSLFAQQPHTAPHFVIAKNMEANTIVVSTERRPRAARTQIELRDTNWIGDMPAAPLQARFRYRQPLIGATLCRQQGAGTGALLNEPQYVPEGQSLVFYAGEQCLGGGIVSKALHGADPFC